MKKIAFMIVAAFVLFSCKSRNEAQKKSEGEITREDDSSSNEKISVAYKDDFRTMYLFSEKQKKKLFGENGEYKDYSICADITIPDDASSGLAENALYPVTFYLYTMSDENDVLNSEAYSKVRIPKSFAGQTVRISVCLPRIPSGFAISSIPGAKVSNMSIERKSIGWIYENGNLKYCFGPSGGVLYSDFSKLDFSDGKKAFPYDVNTEINMFYRKMDPDSEQGTVNVSIGSEKILVRHNHDQRKTSLPAAGFENPYSEFSCGSTDDLVGILMCESERDERGLNPIVADPGLIPDWDMNNWRNSTYEVFAWEAFPNILIFDTENYTVQDKIFKRLAFYAEKNGYIGTLAMEEDIEDIHGFNAYDYRPSVIAKFFNKAYEENFQLNSYEYLLKDLMLHNGLLAESEDGLLVPCDGAVISISRELPEYLRWQFINHEGFHGIYFTHSEFKDEVSRIYKSIDPMSLEFIKTYYTISPELNYDINDEDLVQNEIMAYTLQNKIDRVKTYYLNLANRSHVLKKAKSLSDYIKKTDASGFTSIANELDTFIGRNYGLSAGRVYLISRQK